MISIKADFNMADIEKQINNATQAWFNNLLETFRTKGREFTKRAREQTKSDGGFGNITWNLRGSIGYILLNDGVVIESYFPPLPDGELGRVTGDAYAREIAAGNGFDNGIVLILVAGMDYATYVQNRGIDVLDTESLVFEAELKRIMR